MPAGQKKQIQVDMFDVGLGSSTLVQFMLADGSVVRVLADGGVDRHDSDVPRDQVLVRLSSAMKAFDGTGSPVRIDLMVGSHYDWDHLQGLTAIVEDKNAAIGEVWLPPIANDVEPAPIDKPIEAGNLLSIQFAGEDGALRFKAYVDGKLRACRELRQLRQRARRNDQRPLQG